MTSSTTDVITWGMMLKKAPLIMRNLPRIIKGFRISNISDHKQPCGLGWTFEQAVKRNPRGTAIFYENVRFSYDEFNQWGNRIAHYLMSQGIKKGDVVGVFIENRPELLATVLGVAKIGATCAMLNTSQTSKVLIHSFNLVKPKAAIVGGELTDAFDEVREDLTVGADQVYFLADQDTTKDPGVAPEGYINLATESAISPSHNPDTTNRIYIADPCFYIYTSGTTGLPKAGIFRHGRWMKSYGGFGVMAMRLTPKDVMYSTLPLYHATGLCVCWGSAIAGASGFAIRRKFSASNFWRDVRKYNATAIGYVGELCRYLLDQPERSDDANNPVRKMIGNGLRPNVWMPFKNRFAIEDIVELYAASDGNIGFTNFFNFDNTVGFSPMDWALVEYDKEKEEPVRGPDGFMIKAEKGGQGLLIAEISDKAPLDGYTDPTKTSKVILTDVFEKGDRWFDTGDMLRDIGFGHAQFVDRLGDTFRWKGENVSTTEVENIVSNYPQISEAVVYGVEIPNTNGRAGMASITPAVPLEELDFKDLQKFLTAQLPAYAVPLFLRIKQQMETTGTFKYQKSHLKEQAYDPSKTNGEQTYALLPGSEEYVEITPEILSEINGGKLRY
ncbi:long-chain-acyl-CoA synthetase [Ketobacter sp. MCCC 1A13808]|uniref:long-chain-acyl-CoA synthetase n=1 Tax=Ketobacter sp. MCCC 1A13808 TaxID=2602738 RepID=UPI000F1A7191|nr:long-chain-acyl-CoA synthetase [Ketobacter sp. MCCC 1A13808]MVF14395.1 long-chain-acyl-CoA synthetase [Ketobacter sp. MCCC 1A13808]RLP54377.1 MAG: long-chain-acyl-CoA synthetase [Ketobacter sp.]